MRAPVRFASSNCAACAAPAAVPRRPSCWARRMADPARAQVTVCYLRDQRDDGVRRSTRAPPHAGVDYVEVPERHSFDRQVWPQLRRLIAERADRSGARARLQDRPAGAAAARKSTAAWPRCRPCTAGPGTRRASGYCYYPADKRVLARFPRLIAVSSDIARELIAHGADPARVTTVLNGIDPRQFRRDPAQVRRARAALGLQPDDIAIGAVGRLEPQKRFDLLLEAFAALHAAATRTLRLVIAGDGSLRKPLEAAAPGARPRRLGARLTGHVTDVVAVASRASICSCSRPTTKARRTAVLEAMAHGNADRRHRSRRHRRARARRRARPHRPDRTRRSS